MTRSPPIPAHLATHELAGAEAGDELAELLLVLLLRHPATITSQGRDSSEVILSSFYLQADIALHCNHLVVYVDISLCLD